MDDKSKWHYHADPKLISAARITAGLRRTIEDAIADLERVLADGDGDLRPIIEDLKRGLS